MKVILLNHGKVTFVDDEDFEWLNQWKWHAKKYHRTWYAQRGGFINNRQMTIFMHREILKTPLGKETDHKDGDGLNNQRENLRPATKAQNRQNQRPQEGCTSGFKGVHWDRGSNKWRTHIKIKGKQIHLGVFLSEIDAAKAYDRAAYRYFGEFARTNF